MTLEKGNTNRRTETKSPDTKRNIIEETLYTIGIKLYRVGVCFASIFNSKARKLIKGHGNIYHKLQESISAKDRIVWVHAASLGEFEQGRPLIEKIRTENPQYKILLTFFSPSGYEVRKNYAGADCVCYLPFDTPKNVQKFLELAHPEIAIFVKYEIWRNYLEQLKNRRIPTYLISATFRRSQYFIKHPKCSYTNWLRWYSRIFVQDNLSQTLLNELGINNVTVCGDTRFDRVSEIATQKREINELQIFTRRGDADAPIVMMAGSSWPSDEKIYTDSINRNKRVKLIIAPHEFDTKRLHELRNKFTNGVILLSELRERGAEALCNDQQVLIIDCFGLLSSAYAYCDAAYIGGGFGSGLHNINEAAVYGIPVIYGPNNRKFIEAREMIVCEGGIEVKSRQEFDTIFERLLTNSTERKQRGAQAGAYINSKLGATDKIYDFLRKSL